MTDAPIYTGTKIYWEEYHTLPISNARWSKYRFSPYVTVDTKEKADKVTITRDQDQYGVDLNGDLVYLYTRRESETGQKFWCVGGPLDKTRQSVRQAGEDYEQYNCATRYGKADSVKPPKVILIYKDFIHV
jgi:hypothetical protein